MIGFLCHIIVVTCAFCFVHAANAVGWVIEKAKEYEKRKAGNYWGECVQ